MSKLKELEARYALVSCEYKRLTTALTNARLAMEDNRNVDHNLYSAIVCRRADVRSELERIEDELRELAGDAAVQGAREGVSDE